MAIVNLGNNNDSEFPSGAVCPLEYAHQARSGGFVVVTYETFVGACIAESERNMRDDSDFLMTVQDAGGPHRLERLG